MEKSSPIRRHAQHEQNGVCTRKYGTYFVICILIALFVFLLEYVAFQGTKSVQTIPKIFQAVGVVANRSRTFLSASSSKQGHLASTNTTRTILFRKTHFMTVSGNGRLGNQMFEVAALIGTACRHNYTPFIPKRHRLNRVFDIKYVKDIHMTNSASVGEGKAGVYNVKFDTLSHAKNWSLSGYFQSWKYFHHCRKDILTSFKFKRDIKRKAMEVLKTVKKKGRPLVGVHVRRTDMASSREQRRGYSVATPSYMLKALTYFRTNFEKPLFIVVSDDRSWCHAHVKGPDVVYAGTGRPEVDLAILSLCNHTIVTSGSFGWWGAYLNGGTTVYYSNFPSKGSWLLKQYETKDYYLPEWIGME